MFRFASGATLALTVCLMLGSSALAGSTPTADSAPASPAAQLPMKASKPGVQPDLYCTHNTANSNLPACDMGFKQKCTRAGGKVKDPSGNPDYGVCVHDDLWYAPGRGPVIAAAGPPLTPASAPCGRGSCRRASRRRSR